MNNIVITTATPNDAQSIFNIQRETWIDTYTNSEIGIRKDDIEQKFSNKEERIAKWKEALENAQKSGAHKRCWIAKEGTNTIGFITGFSEGDHNSIAIYILPSHQRQGIGKKLMQIALDWLRNEKPIRFECVAYNNKAINFYKKHGFEVDESVKTEGSPLPSGAIIPTVEMVRR